MAKEIVEAVCSAENLARDIKNTARQEAYKMTQEAKNTAAKIVENTKEEAMARAEEIIADAKANAAKIFDSDCRDDEYEKLKSQLESKMSAAVQNLKELM